MRPAKQFLRTVTTNRNRSDPLVRSGSRAPRDSGSRNSLSLLRYAHEGAFHAALARSAVLKSESFSAGGDIPTAFTCKGAGASPELSWEATPENAQSYVLIVMDWDVPSPSFRIIGFTHWILYNVPRAGHEVKSTVTAAELNRAKIETGDNSLGAAAYTPPCPPMGKHRYVFRIYELDLALIHPASHDRQAIFDAMKGHVLAYGEIVARFGG
jgi:Raf kinase inhibitor-like YbhB/YbcL family protein